MAANPLTFAVIASTAVSAYSAIQQGKYAKAAAEAERQQYEEEKRLAALRAIEDANARDRELISAQASNKALFAAKTGTDPNQSASFLALRDANEAAAERDIGAIRLMGAATARKYQLSSWNSGLEGKSAMMAGYAKAGSTLLGGYIDYKKATG